jgi:hypothetical protein
MGWPLQSHIDLLSRSSRTSGLKNDNIFKVNGQRLKPYIEGTEHTNNVEFFNLTDPIYLD